MKKKSRSLSKLVFNIIIFRLQYEILLKNAGNLIMKIKLLSHLVASSPLKWCLSACLYQLTKCSSKSLYKIWLVGTVQIPWNVWVAITPIQYEVLHKGVRNLTMKIKSLTLTLNFQFSSKHSCLLLFHKTQQEKLALHSVCAWFKFPELLSRILYFGEISKKSIKTKQKMTLEEA